jgi:hypothetical protein
MVRTEAGRESRNRACNKVRCRGVHPQPRADHELQKYKYHLTPAVAGRFSARTRNDCGLGWGCRDIVVLWCCGVVLSLVRSDACTCCPCVRFWSLPLDACTTRSPLLPPSAHCLVTTAVHPSPPTAYPLTTHNKHAPTICISSCPHSLANQPTV